MNEQPNGTITMVPTKLGTLRVDASGTGRPAVLWHSLFVDSRSWNRVRAALGESRRLFMIDGPSHGGSASMTRRFTLDECAGAALDVLDHLEITEPVDWVGNALGRSRGHPVCRCSSGALPKPGDDWDSDPCARIVRATPDSCPCRPLPPRWSSRSPGQGRRGGPPLPANPRHRPRRRPSRRRWSPPRRPPRHVHGDAVGDARSTGLDTGALSHRGTNAHHHRRGVAGVDPLGRPGRRSKVASWNICSYRRHAPPRPARGGHSRRRTRGRVLARRRGIWGHTDTLKGE